MIKGNVLLVDDDKDIVESMEIHLKNEGLKVYKAYDGIEALEILLEKEIHLILMDIMMPVMNEHLTKPLNCEKLIATIVKFL